ncbi:hypothetical protein PybrP1_001238 [[Pythium] brassicae (nom. inval.)]|nr:hypothetical protein PybrP1_001238 [[Pythium] brassicae (nom. inval.)]
MATMPVLMSRKSTIRPRGLNMKDPKVRAELYMQTHGIKELFEGMGTLLLFHRPENPREFLAQHLAEIQRLKQSQGYVPFFEEHDLDAMFAAFDVTDKGVITPKQYDQALKNFGIEQPTLRLPETQELKNASASFM